MDIYIVVQHFDLRKLSGIPRSVYDLTCKLKSMNVTIISDDPEGQKINKVKIFENLCLIRIPASNPLQFLKRATKFIESQKGAIIFYGSLIGSIIFSYLLKNREVIICIYTGKISISDYTNCRLVDIFLSPKRLINNHILLSNLVSINTVRKSIGTKNVLRIITPSFRLKRQIETLLDERNGKVIRVPMCIDISRYDKLYGVPSNDDTVFQVLHFNYDYSTRGADDLIQAWLRITKNIHDIKLQLLLLAASTSKINTKYLQSIVRRYNSDSVKLFSTWSSRIPYYLINANIVVQPYRFIGDIPEYPLTLLESMAAAKPVITTNIGAIPEIVQHLHNGILVRPKSPVQIAEMLQMLIEDQYLSKRLAINARKALAQFSVENIVEKMRQVINGTI